jgi:hypothetical protein
MRSPSRLTSISGFPPGPATATAEYVVPRSMPTICPIQFHFVSIGVAIAGIALVPDAWRVRGVARPPVPPTCLSPCCPAPSKPLRWRAYAGPRNDAEEARSGAKASGKRPPVARGQGRPPITGQWNRLELAPAYFQWPPCWLQTRPVLLHLLHPSLPPSPLARPPLHPWQSCSRRWHLRHSMVNSPLL